MKKNFDKDLYKLSFKMKKELHHRIFSTAVKVFFAVILLNVVLTFVIFSVREKSDAMSPDIPKNALVFVTPLANEIQRGDVVFVEKEDRISSVPAKFFDVVIRFFTLQKKNLLSGSEKLSSRMVLRRVVAVPGDTIYMKDYMVFVRPKDDKHFLTEFERAEKAYNIDIRNLPQEWDVDIGQKAAFSPVTLSAGQYFVLADNRYSAMDSRIWGVVQKEEILGKVLVQYFPFSSVKLF